MTENKWKQCKSLTHTLFGFTALCLKTEDEHGRCHPCLKEKCTEIQT